MLKVGLCGMGSMGQTHAFLLSKQKNVKFVAMADAVAENRKKAKELYGVRTYSTAKAMIGKEKLDAVLICLPTMLHMETAVMALEAGMHVFCEKPMSLSAEQCKVMTKTAKQRKKVLVIGQVLRFKPEYIFLRDAVRSGKYGKLESLTMARVGKVSIGWKRWFLDEERGGTQIFDRHIHDADMVSWIFGLPESVKAYGFERSAEEGGISHSVTKYNYGKGGPLIIAEGSADMPGKFPFTATYRAVFEKACLDFDMSREKQLLVYTDKETFSPESPKEMIFSGSTMNQNIVRPYFLEQKMFFDCIRKGSKPEEITPESAGDTVRLVQAEIKSVRTGKTVKL